MLVIRLARGGRSKYPTYRIVAAESSRAATGKFVEILGHYNPHTKELVIESERIQERLGHGAQPSNTVVKLLQREKVKLPDWVTLKTRDRKPKKEPVEKPVAEAKPEEEPRVAEAATDNAAETEAKATPAGKTETAEDTEAAAEAAESAEDAGAKAAADVTAETAAKAKTDDASDAK